MRSAERLGQQTDQLHLPEMSHDLSVRPAFPRPVLALGGELKNTICVGRGERAHLSETHGDLQESSSYRAFLETVTRLSEYIDNEGFVIGYDMHPTYLSTAVARSMSQRKVAVQHHHAHAVSAAVDAGIDLPVIGIVCDGTGYGTDGATWGGEVLLVHSDSFERLAHLDYFALPGGDAGARHTWRPALSLLRAALPDSWRQVSVPGLTSIAPEELTLVIHQMESGLNSPNTSSLGRLFDGIASLVGIAQRNEFEGQAAIALQAAAVEWLGPSDGLPDAYPYSMRHHANGVARMDWRPMVRSVVSDVLEGEAPGRISARFHATVAVMLFAAAKRAAERSGVDRIVLSGGCFLNEILLEAVGRSLASAGYIVGRHERVSCGDVGLSLGQAVVASATVSKHGLGD